MSLALWNQIPLVLVPILLALLTWIVSLTLRVLDVWRWTNEPRRIKFGHF
ncbi:hypothetical protein [Armatimonas rosea]|uniref:Type VI protein secretion system component VasK n=1 Tax=Armatimonas rosea TaxID=685828 RepID=A0A7W9W4D2_ARMRO|nr:hypothetical protein [Armatimonas rosea]MBB6049309.1 type VI protein secretion system component VasK [Armatimonas rosea]